MEFFRELDAACPVASLQRDITIATLPRFCSEIGEVTDDQGAAGEIYCLWGSFRVHAEPIRGGVRFTLPGCPNALAWTVTSGLPPDPATTVIHCTINRRQQDPDFVESIVLFMDAWQAGVSRYLSQRSQSDRRSQGDPQPGGPIGQPTHGDTG